MLRKAILAAATVAAMALPAAAAYGTTQVPWWDGAPDSGVTQPALLPDDLQLFAQAVETPAPVVVTPAPRPTTVDLGPLWTTFVSYLVPVLGTIIGGGAIWLQTILRTRFNLQIDDSLRSSFQTAVTNAAMVMFTKAKGLLPEKLDVRNPLVADAINYVLTRAPDAAARWGMTPESVAKTLETKVAAIRLAAPTTDPVMKIDPAGQATRPAGG